MKTSQSINQITQAEQNMVNTIYDNADVMQLLKVSRRTLSNWRSNGIIGYSQAGAKIFYTQKDIDEFLQSNYKKRFAK